jgi:uncharacterized protein (DUF1800 family)
VVAAFVPPPACAPFVTGKVARAVLGPDVDPGLVASLAADFARSGLALRPLMRAVVQAGLSVRAAQAGLDGRAAPLVRAPIPWLAAMIKATGADPAKAVAVTTKILKGAGQVPLAAPNVGGWPGGRAWLSSSVTVGRWNLAAALAAVSPSGGPARAAAAKGDWAALADALGLPDGFAPATVSALDQVRREGRAGEAALALAMAAPDGVMT